MRDFIFNNIVALEIYVAICWVIYIVVMLGIMLHQSYCFNREYNNKSKNTKGKKSKQISKTV